MKKSIAMHIVVMIAAVLIGGSMASFLHKSQNDLAPAKSGVSRVPIGGFHKFASDIEWMRFINYMGGLKTINDENKDEVIARLDKIVKLDPNFAKAYHMGALSISNASPEKAVEFLSRACESQSEDLKSNWHIPFLAGFILMHYTTPAKCDEAARFFRIALERSGGKPEDYVVNSYLRAKGRAKNIDNNKLAMLDTLFVEWKKSNSESLETSVIPNLTERLLVAARSAKASSPDDKEIQTVVDQISNKILADKHMCPSCLSSYGPGDKFCSNCGKDVKPYGTCAKCQHVLKGGFCSNCGHKADK